MFYGGIFARSLTLFAVFLVGAAFLRKIWIGIQVLNYVERNVPEVSIQHLLSLPNVNATFAALPNNESTLVMFLNRHILDMTSNWLCNVLEMDGVHSRLLLIVMDKAAKNELAKRWPGLRTLWIDVPSLRVRFNYGDGPYQLFYVFRANVASVLATFGKPFWMIQQDTFWRTNLLKLGLENTNADILFDRASKNDNNKLVAGGYFFVRPSLRTATFFAELAQRLSVWYSPDNVLMSSFCAQSGSVQCALIPFCTITNWIWLLERHHVFSGEGSDVAKSNVCLPALIQFDGDTQLGGKMAKMCSFGFGFLQNDGRTCDEEAVNVTKNVIYRTADIGAIDGIPTANIGNWPSPSYSQWQFACYQWVLDQFYKQPMTTWLLNNVLYQSAHYLMITI